MTPRGPAMAIAAAALLATAASAGAQGAPPTFLNINPSWSPDARRILFSGRSAGGVDEVYAIQADGTGLTRLTRGTEGIR